MKKLMMSVVGIALASSFTGCAVESDDPVESTATSAVTEHAANFVISCAALTLRWCDSPVGCVITTMPYGAQVQVGNVDWGNRMAQITSSPWGAGWALSSLNGEAYLSANFVSPCR